MTACKHPVPMKRLLCIKDSESLKINSGVVKACSRADIKLFIITIYPTLLSGSHGQKVTAKLTFLLPDISLLFPNSYHWSDSTDRHKQQPLSKYSVTLGLHLPLWHQTLKSISSNPHLRRPACDDRRSSNRVWDWLLLAWKLMNGSEWWYSLNSKLNFHP